MSAKHNEWHHYMPRHEGNCPTCHSPTPFGMVIEDPTAALRARCARLEGALLEIREMIAGVSCDAKFSQECNACGLSDIVNFTLDEAWARGSVGE